MLSRYFYGWSVVAIVIFLVAYSLFLYPDGATAFNPATKSDIGSGFSPFYVTYQSCNSSGLFLGLELTSPLPEDLPVGSDVATILNATIITSHGGNFSTECTTRCVDTNTVQINSVIGFDFSGSPACMPEANYSAEIHIWYSYNTALGGAELFASGTVSGTAS